MTETSPSPLTRQIADILAALNAQAEDSRARPSLIASLHALILSALARLVTRLETLLTLWQAGQLPTSTHTAVNRQPTFQAPRTQSAPRATTPQQRARPPAPIPPAPHPGTSRPGHQPPPQAAQSSAHPAPSHPESAPLAQKNQKNPPPQP